MDIETDTYLPSIASKPYTLPLKNQEWVRKQLEYLEKAGVIQRSLSPYAWLFVVVPRKCPPGSCVQETKRICVDQRKVNAQLPTVLRNKPSGVITLVNIHKIDVSMAYLCYSKFFTSLDLRSGYYHIKLSLKLLIRVLLPPYLASTNSSECLLG